MRAGVLLVLVFATLACGCGREYPDGTFLSGKENAVLDTSSGSLREELSGAWLHDCLAEDQVLRLSSDTVVYRFTWNRTFHQPMTFSLIVTENKAELIWKACDGQAGYGNSTKLVMNDRRELTEAEYLHFVQLFNAMDFYHLPLTVETRGLDGAWWILEACSDHYRVVARWSPDGPFRDCCLYLLELTGTKGSDGKIY